MTRHLALLITVGLVVAASAPKAQERETPSDSERVILAGCANGRTFITVAIEGGEIVRSGIGGGRRFRLSGPGRVLDAIKARKGRVVEITGLVRKSALGDPGGISIAGGRIRIGGRQPQTSIATDPARDPAYTQAVLDVEGWQARSEPCPER